ncbi:MAG TPA: hypothetical protein VF618_07585 [Thermoanaerobaculia bacterium]
MNGARFRSGVAALAPEAAAGYYPRYEHAEGGGVSAPAFGTLAPGWLTPLFVPTPPSRSGRLLYLEPAAGDAVALNAYLLSSTDAGETFHETALPIVRSFFTATTHILGVRSSYRLEEIPGSSCRRAVAQFGHTLRIYDIDGSGGGIVRVKLYDEALPTGNLIRETTVALTSRDGTDASYPYFAELPLEEVCHPFSCHSPCTGGSQRVEVTPVSPGLRYWAMVSATDNFTQQVSLAWPQ